MSYGQALNVDVIRPINTLMIEIHSETRCISDHAHFMLMSLYRGI